MKDTPEAVYYSISDFIAPVDTNKKDYIGMFACSILGVDKICQEFEAQFDDYRFVELFGQTVKT